MASINTNYGAMVAAQSFANTSRELDKVQNRVTTGLKVSSAKDNGAIWAIANTQKPMPRRWIPPSTTCSAGSRSPMSVWRQAKPSWLP
jgi:Flagellin and related hook-associated proteins